MAMWHNSEDDKTEDKWKLMNCENTNTRNLAMLSFNDDSHDDFNRGPQHSTPIKVIDNKSGFIWDTATAQDQQRYTDTENLGFKIENSEMEIKRNWPVNSELKNINLPHLMVADVNMCNHRKNNNVHSTDDPNHFSMPNKIKGQSTAAHIEQDVINKQRREIHLLMEELGTRDRELNDLVRSHQSQVQAWEKDRERLSDLQQRLYQYQDELEKNDQQLKETVTEMTRVCEQKESDNADLRKTKEEMEHLAEKINENSRYIQGMEVENKSLTQSVKELIKLRHELEERDREKEQLIKDQDEQISKSQKRIEELNEELNDFKVNSEEANKKLCNANSASVSWERKYCEANEECKRLKGECVSKEETIVCMTQQLHESLQQAIALQKALFTSCEREKCKEEVLYSLRKQQKRTMEELTSLRHLYERQNKDLTLYHLSVREQEIAQEETRQQKRSQERCKSLEKIPGDEKDKEDIRQRVRSKSELKHLPSDGSFLIKELNHNSSSKSARKYSHETHKIINNDEKDGNPSNQEEYNQKSERHSRCTARANNVNSQMNTRTITCNSTPKAKSGTPQDDEIDLKPVLLNHSNKQCEQRKKHDQSRSLSSFQSDCVSQSKQKHNHDTCPVDAKVQEKKHSEKLAKRIRLPEETSEYSESPMSSPERPTGFDEEILSADSEGMCPELKRDSGQIENFQNFRQVPSKDRKNSLLSDMPSSLQPSIHLSSFLKKEVMNISSSGGGDETVKPHDSAKSRLENGKKRQAHSENLKQLFSRDTFEYRQGQVVDVNDENSTSEPHDSFNEVQEAKRNTNNFQAGDYLHHQFKVDSNEPKINGRVKYSSRSAYNNVKALDMNKDFQNSDNSSSSKTDDAHYNDDSLEENVTSAQKIRMRNNCIKVICSSPELAKSPKSNHYHRDKIHFQKPCNAPRSQHAVKNRISEDIRREKRIAPTNSDGFLFQRKDQNRGRPGSRHSPHRNTSNKMRANHQDSQLNRQEKIIDVEDKSRRKCLRFAEKVSQDETQFHSDEISSSSSEVSKPVLNEDSHDNIQEMKSQHDGKYDNFQSEEGDSDEDSVNENMNKINEDRYENKRISTSGRARTATTRSYHLKKEKSYDSGDLPRKLSPSSIRARPLCSSPIFEEKVKSFVKRQKRDSNKEITQRRECNYNNSNADLENSDSTSYESSFNVPIRDVVEDTDIESQLDNDTKKFDYNLDNISNTKADVDNALLYMSRVSLKETKPFCSTRAPSLYKQLSKIHFCEKTKRYEWTSISKKQNEDEEPGKKTSEGDLSCSGDCSLNMKKLESSIHSPSKQCHKEDLIVKNNDLDKISCNSEVVLQSNSENNTSNSNNSYSKSELFEKPSFLSPLNETRTTPYFDSIGDQQFQTVVKKLNFSVTLEEDDLLNECDKKVEVENIPPSQSCGELSIEDNNVAKNVPFQIDESSLITFKTVPKDISKPFDFEGLDEVSIALITDDVSDNDTACNKYGHPIKKSLSRYTFPNNYKPDDFKPNSLSEYFKNISLINSKDEQNETGFQEDYNSVKDKALSVLDKSDIVHSQTHRILQMSSSEYMSFDMKEEINLSKNKNLKFHLPGNIYSNSHLPESTSYHLCEPYKLTKSQTECQKFVENLADESCNSSVQKMIQMSPATKLHRLLLESQDVIHCLQKSSDFPQSLKTKNSLPSNC